MAILLQFVVEREIGTARPYALLRAAHGGRGETAESVWESWNSRTFHLQALRSVNRQKGRTSSSQVPGTPPRWAQTLPHPVSGRSQPLGKGRDE